MCACPVFPGVDHCLASIRRGQGKAVLARLNAVKSSWGTSPMATDSPPHTTEGVDYCRAMCFLAANWWERGEEAHGVLHARQAVLEELRWHPKHVPSRQLLFELNEVARPRLLPPADVQREEPLFCMLVDALLDHTMLTWPRLLNLFHGVQRACESGRGEAGVCDAGHVVECGCAGGGAAVMMAVALQEFDVRRDGSLLGAARCVFALDRFSGMPPPTAADNLGSTGARQSWSTGTCSAPALAVKALAQQFGVGKRLETVEGDFHASIPQLLLKEPRLTHDGVAVLHVDADWYESVKYALTHFLPLVRVTGRSRSPAPRLVQIDDYHYWDGARLAVDEVLQSWGDLVKSQPSCCERVPAVPELQEVDGNAVCFSV